MQTVPQTFTDLANGGVRPHSYQLRMSFDKQFDPDIGFFTLSSDDTPMSLLNGPDVLAPSGDNDIAFGQQYDYADFTDRVVQLEWEREQEVPYSVTLAMADITLNNYDNYFTRGAGGPLDPNILPRRPARILAGFKGINIPQFVGLTETAPKVERSTRTATVHCMDFLSSLFNKNLDSTVMLQDVYTHEVLEYLFDLFELLPSQYVLDDSFNQISFVYWEKGVNLGTAVRDLMQAELGSLYMDELGIIRFKNRVKVSSSPVYTFNNSNIVDYSISDETNIINVVEIRANVRAVQPMQPVYTLFEPIFIIAGQTKEEFFSLTDPITSVGTITNYLANTQADGEGTDATSDITIDDVYAFANSAKVTFTNNGTTDAYLTELEIPGTPAKATGDPLYIRLVDEDSVDQFEEQVLEINNDFVQTSDAANSLGLSLLNYYGNYGNNIQLEVKGSPALQTGDNISVEVDNINDVYTITKIANIHSIAGGFTQRLTARVFNIPDFFILSSDDEDRSLLNGEDVLAP